MECCKGAPETGGSNKSYVTHTPFTIFRDNPRQDTVDALEVVAQAYRLDPKVSFVHFFLSVKPYHDSRTAPRYQIVDSTAWPEAADKRAEQLRHGIAAIYLTLARFRRKQTSGEPPKLGNTTTCSCICMGIGCQQLQVPEFPSDSLEVLKVFDVIDTCFHLLLCRLCGTRPARYSSIVTSTFPSRSDRMEYIEPSNQPHTCSLLTEVGLVSSSWTFTNHIAFDVASLTSRANQKQSWQSTSRHNHTPVISPIPGSICVNLLSRLLQSSPTFTSPSPTPGFSFYTYMHTNDIHHKYHCTVHTARATAE